MVGMSVDSSGSSEENEIKNEIENLELDKSGRPEESSDSEEKNFRNIHHNSEMMHISSHPR